MNKNRPRIFKKFLNNTYHHYSCILRKEGRNFLRLLLNLFFVKIFIDEKQSKIFDELPKNSIIIYIGKNKSTFDFLFYNKQHKNKAVPRPEIALDQKLMLWQPVATFFKIFISHIIYFLFNFKFLSPYKSGFIKKELINGKAGFMHLFAKDSFHNRIVKAKTDPIAYLIELQKTTTIPVYIIPQIIFFNIYPQKDKKTITDSLFGTKENPGKIKRFISFLKKGDKTVFVEFSAPINLQDVINSIEFKNETIENAARKLRVAITKQFNKHRQSVVGPVLKSRRELLESILTSNDLQKFINKYSEENALTKQKTLKKANYYAREIAADYNVKYVNVYKFFAQKAFNSLFENINVNIETLNKLKIKSHSAPLIFVPNHKSHIDYILFTYIIYLNNMPCPHVAAGKNLSFWPVGTLFRKAGAFFLRRTFKGNQLYSKIFSSYIEKMLKEGFNLEFFIEGGRSRTGKSLMPKFGFISILLKAFQNNACEDLIFAPVYIGYDRIIEEKSYIHEIEGGSKESENVKQIVKTRKFFNKKQGKKYGKVYINFHQPISLKKYLEEKEIDIHNLDKKNFRKFCKDLGYKLINAIDSETVITPYSIFAASILNQSQNTFSYDKILYNFNFYLDIFKSYNKTKRFSEIFKDNKNIEMAFKTVLQKYIVRKLIIEHKDDKKAEINLETLYQINNSKRSNIEYYKNNSIILLIPFAFTAFAILKSKDKTFSASSLSKTYEILSAFFINEFAPEHDKNHKYFLDECLDAFVKKNMIKKNNLEKEEYTITNKKKLKLLTVFLKTYFESYYIVFKFLSDTEIPKTENKTKTIKKIQTLGSKMLKRNIINRIESTSIINYKNALSFFNKNNLLGKENEKEIKQFGEFITSSLEMF